MPERVKTVLDVVEGGKWNKALFTTYALSLSFFESILLRALRQVGCQEIWVISDVQGYKASLIERRSHSIGHDYRLIPIRLGKGVFHPKCIYLAGPDEDVIAIGSGNLTFGGFGRNLEVLEVFSSVQTPALFNEFADLLASLRTRDDFECPDRAWCTTFADRARGVGAKANGAPGIRLIHSAAIPIIDQLIQALPGVDELTVLSPFYDNDGYAIRTTIEKLGCNTLRVAIPPNIKSFNFPFEDARRWGKRIQPVWADTADSKRSIHAKWFEFRGKHASSVMTGSANATRQALCTTNNIEVSVLRTGSANEKWVSWKESQLPKSFVPTAYSSSGAIELLAHATLSGDVLEGMILGLSAEAGCWKGMLTKPNGDTKEFTAHLNDDARFQVADLTFSNFAFSSGVQILLSSGDHSARGWVQSEDVLRMTRLPKFNLGALLRIIARENTEDDDIALLEYLAIYAQKHLPSFVGRIKSLKEGNENPQGLPLITVDLEELAPTTTPSTESHGEIDLAEQGLERVFAQLRKRLLGHGPKSGLQVVKQSAQELESDSTDPEEAAAEADSADDKWVQPLERIQSSLDEFDHRMRILADSPELVAADRRGLLVLWFEVMMCMLLMRKGDVEGAHKFLNEWTNTAARLVKARSEADSLEQHFVTSIAVLARKNPAGDSDFHELLELYYAGEVEASRLVGALLPPTGIPFGAMNVPQDDSLQGVLLRVLQATTLRQELVAIIDATKRGESINAHSPLFKGGAGHIILAELRNFSGTNRFIEQIGDELVCAKCFVKLPKVMATSLEYCRIAFHQGWFTVRTK
jgi:HKD family nuclease